MSEIGFEITTKLCQNLRILLQIAEDIGIVARQGQIRYDLGHRLPKFCRRPAPMRSTEKDDSKSGIHYGA